MEAEIAPEVVLEDSETSKVVLAVVSEVVSVAEEDLVGDVAVSVEVYLFLGIVEVETPKTVSVVDTARVPEEGALVNRETVLDVEVVASIVVSVFVVSIDASAVVWSLDSVAKEVSVVEEALGSVDAIVSSASLSVEIVDIVFASKEPAVDRNAVEEGVVNEAIPSVDSFEGA
ncbi:hypothetical protein FALBO_6037 [Fusarium albosuccineum]|uniref:Uncharacterized protein n=1 Tax=Fusarium albosuccineum TaxID=1237068 RepID=A0A8H4PF00_9HYPO|nr:hypothetical protein FALBO_6037 [Fusarium albosuccineum]